MSKRSKKSFSSSSSPSSSQEGKKRQVAKAKESASPAAATAKASLGFRLREGGFILVLAAAGFFMLSLITYHRADSAWSSYSSQQMIANAAGLTGAWLADVSLYFLGYVAFFIPFALCYSGWNYCFRRREERRNRAHFFFKCFGMLLVFISMSCLLELFVLLPWSPLPLTSGGVLGEFVTHYMLMAFNYQGAVLLLYASLLVGLTLFTGLSWLRMAELIGRGLLQSVRYICIGVKKIPFAAFFSAYWRGVRRSAAGISKAFQALFRKNKPSPASNSVPVNHSSIASTHRTPLIATQPTQADINARLAELKARSQGAATDDHAIHRHAKPGDAPSLDLLDAVDTQQEKEQQSHEALEQQSRQVEIKLADFGVKAQVVAVYPGPVVTRYEIDLAAGTKVSKITALAKDLARSLSVLSVRVVEVIPGKSVVGLELPNVHRAIVNLQEVFASDAFLQSNSALALALGKDIAGHAVVVDLAKMPHLLVAGTTGSGKSVGLNAMLLSLLYKATPATMRLILIDPKMLELAIYEDIPHLLVPVVTDMKEAANALRWCVVEMERRYRLMAALGVRNIAGFNQKVAAAIAGGDPLPDPTAEPSIDGTIPTLEEMPKIVIIADEFADMMMVVGKKVETLIARLAQKARAAGIHLILATQRPSVDVITGLIKANIPSRISFQVSSRIDSRTILDQQGAEHLLGHGDMLYLPPGSGIPIRVHGAYVSDEEVHRVVNFLKATAKPNYLNEILGDMQMQQVMESDPVIASMSGDESAKDSLFDQAVEFVAQAQRASISSVQRRFKIGYNRAARIIENMEAEGMLGPMESNGVREILLPKPRKD